ncbi:MAG TPA: hypothetical protein EYN67_04390 [Flavobacteriales bacterium]|nr:hypothetical protein [Flavobacteriales bacterium]
METFKVGDLVRDKLNEGDGAYGLGVIVRTEEEGLLNEERPHRSVDQAPELPGNRYDVYFNKFETTITFHGDYLEKV